MHQPKQHEGSLNELIGMVLERGHGKLEFTIEVKHNSLQMKVYKNGEQVITDHSGVAFSDWGNPDELAHEVMKELALVTIAKGTLADRPE